MSINVTIPVTLQGYTGQREQWESFTDEYKVERNELNPDMVFLKPIKGYGGREILLDIRELQEALTFLDGQERE